MQDSPSEISSSSQPVVNRHPAAQAPLQAPAGSAAPKTQILHGAYGLVSGLHSAEEQSLPEEAAAEHIKKNLITIRPDFIKFGEKLGNGAFGIVYRGEYWGMPVAIKEVDPRKAGRGVDLPPSDILQAFEWEVSRLSTLSHPNLVHFYGVCENEEGNACLVMELCQKDTLEKRLIKARAEKLDIILAESKQQIAIIKSGPDEPHLYGQYSEEEEEEEEEVSRSNYDRYEPAASSPQPKPQPKTLTEPPLPLSEIWRIAIEVAYGLAYLHQKGTLHRDLKSENILFGSEGQVKLADLGVAQVDALVSSEQAKVVEEGMKDARYAAPEEFQGHSTPRCDMYSYGLVLWELISGEIIPPDHKTWRKQGKPEVIPDYCPASFRSFIEKCWSLDPQQRPAAQEAILGLEAMAADYTDQPAKACLIPQMSEILEEQHTALSEYIPSFIEPPKGQKPNKNQEPISIQIQLQAFMASEIPVCVIMGIGGLGKSLAGYVLASMLLQHANPYTPIPILIRPGIAPWHHTALQNGIETALTHYRISPEGIQQLKRIPILFILDGYDELSGESQGNLPHQLGLEQWPNAKLVLSVRPGVVEENRLMSTFGLNDEGVFYTILPLEAEQVQAYLDRALLPEEAQALKARLPQTLRQTLMNPFVLSLFCKSWESQKKQALNTLTQSAIYSVAIEHWIRTSANQLPVLIQQQLASNVSLLAAAQSWLYQTAFTMAANKTLSLVPIDHPWNQLTQLLNDYAGVTLAERDRRIAAMPPEEASKAQRRVLLTPESYQRFLHTKAQQFFALCPLKDRNGQQQFIHKSLWEYNVAVGMIQALSHPIDQPEAVIATQLHPRWMLTDGGVLTFLQALSHSKEFKHWITWIETSKNNPKIAQPAACAITALNGLQKEMTYRDFRGIHVPEADLRGAYLDNSDLSGADLSYTLLNNISLNGTCLSQANCWGVQLGQHPSLIFETNVFSIALHPNGQWLAAGSISGEIVLQDIQTRRMVRMFEGHTSLVNSIALSPNGQMLASGSQDKTVCLWRIETGEGCLILTGHTGKVTSVAFSPEGQILASGSQDKTVCLWEVDTGKTRSILVGHTGEVTSVAFSPDGQILASGSGDNTVRLWRVKTGEAHYTLTGHTRVVTCVAFSPNGQTLASSSHDTTARLWRFNTGEVCYTLRGHTGEVNSIAFSPDGKTLASGSFDRTVRLWRTETGETRHILTGHTSFTNNVAFSPNGQMLASGGGDRTVRLWRTETGEARHTTLTQHTNRVTSVAFNRDGKTLVSGSWDTTVRLWRTKTGEARYTLTQHTNKVTSAAFSPDGQTLASGSWDATIRLWRTETGEALHTLTGHISFINSVAFSTDGQTLVSGGEDKTVRLWRVKTGEACHTLIGHTEHVISVAFSPDGQRLASAGGDQTVRLWRVKTGEACHTLMGHTEHVISVAFSPNGQTLASGSLDQTIRLWKVKTGKALHVLMGHARQVNSVAFSPDGQILASGSGDETMRLWDIHAGQCLKVWPFTGNVYSISYSSFGQLGVGFGQTVQVWTAQPQLMTPSSDGSIQVPLYRLTWTSAPCKRLTAQSCDIEGVIGLTEIDIVLLEQLGAIGKSAQAPRVPIETSIRSTAQIEEIVEPPECSDRKEALSAGISVPFTAQSGALPVSRESLQTQSFFHAPKSVAVSSISTVLSETASKRARFVSKDGAKSGIQDEPQSNLRNPKRETQIGSSHQSRSRFFTPLEVTEGYVPLAADKASENNLSPKATTCCPSTCCAIS